jgi:hypothetical protein
MSRAALSVVSRTLLWMATGALIVIAAQRFGATLFAQALPDGLRPAVSETAEMTPEKIMDALKDIRGALE